MRSHKRYDIYLSENIVVWGGKHSPKQLIGETAARWAHLLWYIKISLHQQYLNDLWLSSIEFYMTISMGELQSTMLIKKEDWTRLVTLSSRDSNDKILNSENEISHDNLEHVERV